MLAIKCKLGPLPEVTICIPGFGRGVDLGSNNIFLLLKSNYQNYCHNKVTFESLSNNFADYGIFLDPYSTQFYLFLARFQITRAVA